MVAATRRRTGTGRGGSAKAEVVGTSAWMVERSVIVVCRLSSVIGGGINRGCSVHFDRDSMNNIAMGSRYLRRVVSPMNHIDTRKLSHRRLSSARRHIPHQAAIASQLSYHEDRQ